MQQQDPRTQDADHVRRHDLDEVAAAIHRAHPVLPRPTVDRLVERLAGEYSFLAGTLLLDPVLEREAARLLDYVFDGGTSSTDRGPE